MGSHAQGSRDHDFLYFAGAFANFQDLRVTEVPCDEAFIHESVSTVDLRCVARVLHSASYLGNITRVEESLAKEFWISFLGKGPRTLLRIDT